MPKKKTSKKKSTKKTSKKTPKKTTKTEKVIIERPSSQDTQTMKMLMSNFVSLQKVLTNLSSKLDDVSTQMSKLLDLFEISAKSLADKDFDFMNKSGNKDLDKKLDSLVEQNKTIARGFTLMNDKLSQQIQNMQPPKPNPQPTKPSEEQTSKSLPYTGIKEKLNQSEIQNQQNPSINQQMPNAFSQASGQQNSQLPQTPPFPEFNPKSMNQQNQMQQRQGPPTQGIPGYMKSISSSRPQNQIEEPSQPPER